MTNSVNNTIHISRHKLYTFDMMITFYNSVHSVCVAINTQPQKIHYRRLTPLQAFILLRLNTNTTPAQRL